VVDFVFLKQIGNTLGELIHGFVFALHHVGEVEFYIGINTQTSEVFLCRLIKLSGVEQRFGRDAANIQASSAKCIAGLDTGHFKAQLSCANGAVIAARAAANNYQIISVRHMVLHAQII